MARSRVGNFLRETEGLIHLGQGLGLIFFKSGIRVKDKDENLSLF